MPPARLSAAELSAFLVDETPASARVARALRRVILEAAPEAAEGVRFRALSYFHPDAPLGSIGGHIASIEVSRGRVRLAFLHGVALDDPAGLLAGRAKSKRSVDVPNAAAAQRPELAALIRASAALRPWE